MSENSSKPPANPIEEALNYGTTWAIEKGAEQIVGHIPAKVATQVIKTIYDDIIEDSVKSTVEVLSNLDDISPAKKAAYYAMSPLVIFAKIASRIFDK